MIGALVFSVAVAVAGYLVARQIERGHHDLMQLLAEMRCEQRRIRLAQEEILDLWRLSSSIVDPLDKPIPAESWDDITPALKGKRKHG